MSGTVRFTVDDTLRSILVHAETAPRCVLPYGEGDAPGPGLYLVKDRGVYLMSAGSPRQERDDGGKGSPVKYAEGLYGDDEGWYQAAHAICGGDDFVEFLPAEWFRWVVTFGRPSFGLEFRDGTVRLVK